MWLKKKSYGQANFDLYLSWLYIFSPSTHHNEQMSRKYWEDEAIHGRMFFKKTNLCRQKICAAQGKVLCVGEMTRVTLITYQTEDVILLW